MNVEYPDLTDYLAIAAEVTGTDLKTITNATSPIWLIRHSMRLPPASGTRSSTPTFATKPPSSSYDELVALDRLPVD